MRNIHIKWIFPDPPHEVECSSTFYKPLRTFFFKNSFVQEFKLQAWGRSAHHCGCNAIALTPRCTNLYLASCNRGNASELLSGVPVGSWAPVQNTSAAAAVRGHTIGSRLDGSDCSVHNSVSPENIDLNLNFFLP